jgi:hypothetical protein
MGTLLLVIGGRNNTVGECMTLDVYDTETSDWYKLPKVDRFRHICFLIEDCIYIQGGFNQETPTIPTDSMIEIKLNKAFADYPNLYKGLAFELGRDVINHNTHNSNPRRNSSEYANSVGQGKKSLQIQS